MNIQTKEENNVRLVEYIDEENYQIYLKRENDKVNIANPDLIGDQYIDRDIWYFTDVVQSDGSLLNELRQFAIAGSYISKDMMEEALKYESIFKTLNEELNNIKKSIKYYNELTIEQVNYLKCLGFKKFDKFSLS
jgi:hypothetical protein